MCYPIDLLDYVADNFLQDWNTDHVRVHSVFQSLVVVKCRDRGFFSSQNSAQELRSGAPSRHEFWGATVCAVVTIKPARSSLRRLTTKWWPFQDVLALIEKA